MGSRLFFTAADPQTARAPRYSFQKFRLPSPQRGRDGDEGTSQR
jgi:hypothetical protein